MFRSSDLYILYTGSEISVLVVKIFNLLTFLRCASVFSIHFRSSEHILSKINSKIFILILAKLKTDKVSFIFVLNFFY